jgi:hypothetical protein
MVLIVPVQNRTGSRWPWPLFSATVNVRSACRSPIS